MAERNLVYFVSDVHLGLRLKDPEEREARFIAFLKGLPAESVQALYCWATSGISGTNTATWCRATGPG